MSLVPPRGAAMPAKDTISVRLTLTRLLTSLALTAIDTRTTCGNRPRLSHLTALFAPGLDVCLLLERELLWDAAGRVS